MKLTFPVQLNEPLVEKFANGGATHPLFIGCELTANALLPLSPFLLAQTENHESTIKGLGLTIKAVVVAVL